MAKKKAAAKSANAVGREATKSRESAKRDRQQTRIGSAAFAEAAECLKTIAHPVRLRMIQLLLDGRYTVGELAADCQIPDNVASEHLRLMQRCGFFTSQREGRRVYYQVAEPHLKQLMACIEGRFLQT
ncbi:ArsR family transcriptional regulator [Rhodopirellula maiorica SM1]|uniref:ArsR family transcriptional regulator n=1 Tax=Rhodopirellula maiorica SM1 TaxID=1265738 RepID=M5RP53_9BACT|nr:metalloregulator ArsR/SmtB family transcription factor [Rhodopirellula maiorica]EMI21113.1 ArsR family transcriptional regulator [Rhodopirellula maiorica SM1]